MPGRGGLVLTVALVALGGCTALLSTSGLSDGEVADGSSSSAAGRADGSVVDDGGGAARDAIVDEVDATADADGVLWTNGHRYAVRLYPSAVTWDRARDDAVSAGGHLVTITSTSEQAFVVALLDAQPSAFNEGYGPWIGAHQPNPGTNEPAGGWEWVTGEPWSYTRWGSAEPNNSGGEDYAHIFSGNTWNDIDLEGFGQIRSAVVEYE